MRQVRTMSVNKIKLSTKEGDMTNYEVFEVDDADYNKLLLYLMQRYRIKESGELGGCK